MSNPKEINNMKNYILMVVMSLSLIGLKAQDFNVTVLDGGFSLIGTENISLSEDQVFDALESPEDINQITPTFLGAFKLDTLTQREVLYYGLNRNFELNNHTYDTVLIFPLAGEMHFIENGGNSSVLVFNFLSEIGSDKFIDSEEIYFYEFEESTLFEIHHKVVSLEGHPIVVVSQVQINPVQGDIYFRYNNLTYRAPGSTPLGQLNALNSLQAGINIYQLEMTLVPDHIYEDFVFSNHVVGTKSQYYNYDENEIDSAYVADTTNQLLFDISGESTVIKFSKATGTNMGFNGNYHVDAECFDFAEPLPLGLVEVVIGDGYNDAAEAINNQNLPITISLDPLEPILQQTEIVLNTIQELANGFYYIHLRFQNGTVCTRKFVK